MEDLLKAAFLMGFMVSREGFNGECAFEHCAPSEVEPDHPTSCLEFKEMMRENQAFQSLREDAVKRLMSAVGGLASA